VAVVVEFIQIQEDREDQVVALLLTITLEEQLRQCRQLQSDLPALEMLEEDL
jgi:hypothetical protein